MYHTRRLAAAATYEPLSPFARGLNRSLPFLPNNVPIGIEPADPIDVRSAAYPIPFSERQ